MDVKRLQERSRSFYQILKDCIENLVLNSDLPMIGKTQIGSDQIYYTETNKIKINLN